MSSVPGSIHAKQMSSLKYWAVLLYLLVFVLVGAVLVYQKANLSYAVLGQLTQVNQLKFNQLTHWMDERVQDAYLLGEMQMVQKIAQSQVAAADLPALIERLELMANRRGYAQILVLDAQGELVTQTNHLSQLNPEQTRLLWRALLSTSAPRFSNQIKNEQGVPFIDLVAPIRENGSLVGGLVLRVDPAHFIEPLIAFWPSNVTTALSFFSHLQHNQIVALTPINLEGTAYHPGKRLSGYDELVRLRQSGAAQSTLETLDFSGQKVWLACHYVPQLDRCLVSQIRQDELLGSVYQFSLLLLLIGWLVVTLLIWGIWRVYRMAQMEQQINHQTEIHALVQERKAYYEGLFFNAPLPYMSLDNKGIIQSVNQAWLDLFGYDNLQQVEGKAFIGLLPPSSQSRFDITFSQLLVSHRPGKLELMIEAEQGKTRVLSLQTRVSKNASGMIERIHCIFSDVTEQQLNEMALQQAASVFEYTTEGIMITDADAKIISVNPAFTSLLGYTADEVVGQNPNKLKSGRHDASFYAKVWAELAKNGHWSGEVWNRRKNGELIAEWLSITTIYDAQKKVKNYVGIFADISRLKQNENQMLSMANQDHLTGLPNRRHFMTRLQHALDVAQRKHTRLAVIMLDVDRFKGVNDSYGHEVGDSLLKSLAQMFAEGQRTSDMVARLGGDEFAFLLEDIQQPEDAGRIAAHILERLAEPITLSNGVEVMLSATAGISLFPDMAKQPEQLLQQADTALYRAKAEGPGNFFYFTQNMTFQAQERLILEAQLKQALKQNQFVVYYQPKVEVATGRAIGAEALVRWQHPDLGLLAPNTFIEVCEETGLVIGLGEWVLHETCRQGKIWLADWGSNFHLAVNVAASQWQQPQWVETVEKVLKQTRFPPNCLELEITENSLLRAEETVMTNLSRLHRLGVRISIDDFGTGYSSLSYLKRLPLNSLKIDKSFVDDLEVNTNDQQIVRAIIAMAHSLNLSVVCEGIEYPGQLAFIQAQACEFYQGYYMSEPLAARDFEAFMAQQNTIQDNRV